MLEINWQHYVVIACALFVLSVYPMLPTTPINAKLVGALGIAALLGLIVYKASNVLLTSK